MAKLKIGFIPEHFSTPLHFAQKHYALSADLIPFPTGTGALVAGLKAADIDVAIGLTEGFVSDLGKTKTAKEEACYGLAGTYVQSPLCWAISTGAKREDVHAVADLKGKRVGVSRIGSGSYVMSFVLADQHNWLQPTSSEPPFPVVPIGDFAALRKSVGSEGVSTAESTTSDFFMWEHFTTKHFWDNGELKRVGEIYTPWPSWVITARKDVAAEDVQSLTQKLDQGVKHYHEHKDEAVEYITSAMHYSKEDALEWMKTVDFASQTSGVSATMVDNVVGILQKAGVLQDSAGGSADMISIDQK